MSFVDWVYIGIGSYLIITGIFGFHMKILWLTFTFRIKFYDFEYLYGRTFARILFIFLGVSILLVHFVLLKDVGEAFGV